MKYTLLKMHFEQNNFTYTQYELSLWLWHPSM